MTGKNIKENSYTVLGIMSGTSLDGVDLALCKFRIEKGKWNYQIIDAKTISYPSYWKTMLKDAYTYDEDRLNRLDSEYGEYLGKLARHFLGKKSGTDFISSHGHTIFHNPDKGITRQIGNGKEIAKVCKIPVVFDFRTNDVALGGQGAPLVPVGDRDLFGQYDACLNLGGFSNISFEKNKIRKAFDICPVNIVLNQFALEFGKDFDKNGDLGRNGIIIPSLLEKLNSITYYSQTGPSSLGVEWLEKEFYPVVKNKDYQTENILSTLYEHISYQISNVLIKNNLKNVMSSPTIFDGRNLYDVKDVINEGFKYVSIGR